MAGSHALYQDITIPANAASSCLRLTELVTRVGLNVSQTGVHQAFHGLIVGNESDRQALAALLSLLTIVPVSQTIALLLPAASRCQ